MGILHGVMGILHGVMGILLANFFMSYQQFFSELSTIFALSYQQLQERTREGVIMNNTINLEAGEYTLEEFTEILSGVLESLAVNELNGATFLGGDVYAVIYAVLGYINESVPGRFEIVNIDNDTYRIRYTTSDRIIDETPMTAMIRKTLARSQ